MTNIMFFRSVKREECGNSSSESSEIHTQISMRDDAQSYCEIKREAKQEEEEECDDDDDDDEVLVDGINLKTSSMRAWFFGSKHPLACIRLATIKVIRKINLFNNQKIDHQSSRRKEESSDPTYHIIKGRRNKRAKESKMMEDHNHNLFADTEEGEFINSWKSSNPNQIDPHYHHPFRRLHLDDQSLTKGSWQRRLGPVNSSSKAMV